MALLASKADPFAAMRREDSTSSEFEELYTELAPLVWRWVRRLTGPGVDVEDLVQEIFLRAYRGLPSFRRESNPKTWLYRITVNLVIRHRGRRRLKPWHVRAYADSFEPPAAPDGTTHSRDAEALLYRALDSLNEKQRAILIAFELEDLSGPELARALGMKESTLWVQLHRARQALQKQLEALDAR